MRFYLKYMPNALIWCLGSVLLLEAGAMYFSPYRHYPQASAVTRNPSALRGWPEYLQGQTLSDVKRVAIIGNSQSTTRELEQDEIYVALLRKRFLGAGLSVAIENWSIDGLRSDQIELLMAQAIARSMDLVVISVSISNINISREFRFDRHAADLDLLVANSEVWPWLDKTHSLAQISLEQIIWRRLQLLSALARSRTSIHDQFALSIPVKYHRDVFGHWLPRIGPRLPLQERPVAVRAGDNPQAPKNGESAARGKRRLRQFKMNRLPTVERLLETAQQTLKQNGIRAIWVWMPVRPWSNNFVSASVAPFVDLACKEAVANEVPCLNLVEALPEQRFYSRLISSHFDRLGNERIAEILYPRLLDELY